MHAVAFLRCHRQYTRRTELKGGCSEADRPTEHAERAKTAPLVACLLRCRLIAVIEELPGVQSVAGVRLGELGRFQAKTLAASSPAQRRPTPHRKGTHPVGLVDSDERTLA